MGEVFGNRSFLIDESPVFRQRGYQYAVSVTTAGRQDRLLAGLSRLRRDVTFAGIKAN